PAFPRLNHPTKDKITMFRTVLTSALLLTAGLCPTLMPSAVQAGELRGPQTRRGTLAPNDRQDTFTFQFRGREQALIIVNNTSNRGDIDLVVEDDNGRVVARDFKANDDASVAFTPRATGTYYVKVKYFRGPGVLRYTLTTN